MALTAGIILLNTLLPKNLNFKDGEIVDSKKLKEKLTEFAKTNPKAFSRNITKITKLGEKISYFMGSNVGLDDIDFGSKELDLKVSKIEKRVNAEKNIDKKRDILRAGFSSMSDIVKKQSERENNNEILSQIRSGSRGNPSQLARTSLSPIYSVDMEQLPKKVMIKNNFAKGLSPVEYFNVSSQGRFSSVAAANATSEPGALSKVIVANTEDIKITMNDCHTKNGIKAETTDPHIIGRFEAGTDKFITLDYFKKLSKKKRTIIVRSPISCEAKRGVCVKCYGTKANGQLVKVGDNVGIQASQTVGQIMTQMTLSTKHSTMGKGTEEAKLTGVDGFNALYSSKSSATGMAITSKSDGFVKSIYKTNSGHIIAVDGKKYNIPDDKKIIVKIGQKIKKGEPITAGVIPPEITLSSKGIYKARAQEADEAHKIFQRSTGKDLQKKHFEVISRGHISLARDNLGNYSNYDEVMHGYPSSKTVKFLSKDLKGMYLADNIGYIPKGLLLTDDILAKFKKWNIKRISVTRQRPPVKPAYKSLEQRPMFSNNVFGKMNYRGIKSAIKDQIVYNSNNNNIISDKSRYTGNF